MHFHGVHQEKKSQHSVMNIDLGSTTTQQTFRGSSVEMCAEPFLAGRHAPLPTPHILPPCAARVAAGGHYRGGVYIRIPQLTD